MRSLVHFLIFVTVFCLGTWGLIVGGIGYAKEIFLGMIAPLLIGTVSISFLFNSHQKAPENVTKVMIKSFAAKMIIYGLYFIYIFTFYTFNPLPFILSFLVYFVTLHMSEALFLKSIFK